MCKINFDVAGGFLLNKGFNKDKESNIKKLLYIVY